MSKVFVTGTSMINCLGETSNDIMNRIYLNKGAEKNFDIKSKLNLVFELIVKDALDNAKLTLDDLCDCKSLIIASTSAGDVFENAFDSSYFVDDYTKDFFCKTSNIDYLHVSSSCTSSAEAISLGCDFIHSSEYQIVVCVGMDIVDKYRVAGHKALGTVSATQCKPFSKDSNGTRFEDGAACIVLESLEYAERRKACILAEIIGYASMTDNKHFTAPDVNAKGAIGVIQKAITRAGVTNDDVSYINAHGTGTKQNDEMEVKAINAVFTHKNPLISSTKASHGHLLGATAITEIIICIFAQQNKLAPPIYGASSCGGLYDGPNYVVGYSQPFEHGTVVMSLAFGFGGTCNALLLR